MGRVDISARKWIKKAPPWCQQLRGVSNNIGGILVKVRGSGVKVRLWTLFGRETTKCKGFYQGEKQSSLSFIAVFVTVGCYVPGRGLLQKLRAYGI